MSLDELKLLIIQALRESGDQIMLIVTALEGGKIHVQFTNGRTYVIDMVEEVENE